MTPPGYWKLRTEGDCEGRTMKTIGYFYGNVDQIATYITENNMSPYYHWELTKVDPPVTDVSNVVPHCTGYISSTFGKFEIRTSEEVRKMAAKKAALAKLSSEEKELLGLEK